MSDIVTVAVNGIPQCDNMSLLSPEFILTDGIQKVRVHHSPTINIDDGRDFRKNFDYLIDLEENSKFLNLRDILGDSFIHCPRVSKFEQYNKMVSASRQFPNVIQFPTVFNTFNDTGIDTDFINVRGDYVVVKIDNGARGLGQAIVPVHNLRSFISDARSGNLTDEFLKDRFPAVRLGNTDHTGDIKTEKLFSDYDLIINEYIPNIKKEFRILFDGLDIVGYQRKIDSSDSKKMTQANWDYTSNFENPIELLPWNELDTGWKAPTQKQIVEYLKSMGMKFGSVDFYLTEDHQLGMFEYCTQFGFSNIKPSEIEFFNRSVIENLIKGN